MIKHILDLLNVVKGDTENIRIAQGKYYLPDTFKDGFSQIKKEARWLRNTN
jgi:hypothetical protein